MTKKIFSVDNLRCVCISNPDCKRVVYMIYPAGVSVFSDEWLAQQAFENKCSLVVVYVASEDWDNLLTPWPAPGVPKGSAAFKGLAPEFNHTLISKIIPEAESELGLTEIAERDLMGVSLSGLFTLWQWLQYDTFHSIACLSGSFWYEGFRNWFDRLQIPVKTGKAFFLLGKEEPKSKVKAFKTVGLNTEEIVNQLANHAIAVKFEWVEGNHFANPLERVEKALSALAQ